MHACGHDTHVAMLASAARVLADHRDDIAGRVLLMFQPGEEGFHGARHMIEEGLLDDRPRPPRRRATRCTSPRPCPPASVQSRPGPLMAAADVLRVTVTGRGGHASAPHDALDPVPAAAADGRARCRWRSRGGSTRTTRPSLTIAHITAGTTNNVIPETAFLEGTLRTLSGPCGPGCSRRSTGCAGTPRWPTAARRWSRSSRATRSPSTTRTRPPRCARWPWTCSGASGSSTCSAPIMGAEDFSYVLAEVPGRARVPRRLPARRRSGHRAAQPLQPRRVRRGRDGRTGSRCTPGWRCGPDACLRARRGRAPLLA